MSMALGAGVLAACSASGAPDGGTPASPAARPEVVAVYYPHWHSYDHGSSWKGEGWTEWEGMKAAVPRFPGHHQPLKSSWGCFDESDPAWVAREIDLAADHGIDVFLYDWYWYSGVKNMEEALERGFLQATNRARMKFALMWANHDRRDQFCPAFGEPRTVWLPSRHTPQDMARVVDYGIEHYFREPNYWRAGGRLFFSIFEAAKFVEQLGGPAKTREVLASMDARLRAAGLPGMHWNAMTASAAMVPALKEAGFHSTSRYNINSAGKAKADGTEAYEDIMQAHREHWARMLDTPLVNLPVVTRGWDVTPRCLSTVPWPFPMSPKTGRPEYPYVPVVTGSTPERFETLLRESLDFTRRDPRGPFAVLVYAWNEWTEGGYLLPEEKEGTAHLEAIRRVFGVSGARGATTKAAP